MTEIVELSKHVSNVVRWTQKGASNDASRPGINGIRVDKNIVACDGFRLHVANMNGDNPLQPLEGNTVLLGNIKAGENICKAEINEGYDYPDWRQILPIGDPVFEIAINPKLGKVVVLDYALPRGRLGRRLAVAALAWYETAYLRGFAREEVEDLAAAAGLVARRVRSWLPLPFALWEIADAGGATSCGSPAGSACAAASTSG